MAFGETSGSGAYGVIADAGADIYRAHGIGPLSKSGWMTTVSCGSFSNFCRSTTICEKSTESKSSLMVACDNLEGTYGGEEMTSLMAVNPSLMKISVFPIRNLSNSLCSALTMHSLPITFRMSTISPRGSALVLPLLSSAQLQSAFCELYPL